MPSLLQTDPAKNLLSKADETTAIKVIKLVFPRKFRELSCCIRILENLENLYAA